VSQSTLVAHSPKFNAKLVTLDALRMLPEPQALGTRHKPVPHAVLIDTIHNEMDKREMTILREQFALSHLGKAIFGVMDLKSTQTDRTTSFGFRSSIDQLLAIKAVAGTRVFVCDNLALSGDTIAFQRKSTTGLDLPSVVAAGFDRFVEQSQILNLQIEVLSLTTISDIQAKTKVFDIFNTGILPVRLFHDVNRFYFKPTDEQTDCQPRTLWGLHNAMTRAARDLTPVRLFRASVELGRAFDLHTGDGDDENGNGDILDGDVVDVE